MSDPQPAALAPPQVPFPNLRNRLSTRIIVMSITALVVALGMTFCTLWLSWQLEGAAAAINDTGSLRMRASRLALHMTADRLATARNIALEVDGIDATLAELERGNPVRPLFLPNDRAVRAQMRTVVTFWNEQLRPAATGIGGTADAYLELLPSFVEQANHLVGLIESDNAGKIALLRMSQGVLILIACVGTLTIIYLLYLWIIVPLMQMQQGLQRMKSHDFSVRLPVETQDEFGAVADGFNQMASELESLYGDLEARVNRKTALLAAQNKELSALYDMTAFLNQPGDIEGMSRGFLQRVIRQFGADGGSIRMTDQGDKLHLVVSEGLSPELEDHEHCMNVDACFCGSATKQGFVVIKDFSKVSAPGGRPMNCAKEGFKGIAVFRIETQNAVLGSFSLHFRDDRAISSSETHLLEALGQHLGIALENLRLSAQARQLAVAAERNLVAQGLHDSIAQGLNYLNLQVQMLESAVRQNAGDEIRAIVPRLQLGVAESYQDVRELLLNFRSKLESGTLDTAIRETLARFERQTGIKVELSIDESNGAPLPPEQQLQVIFILQEALSNVRKHAHAGKVAVRVENRRDFDLTIEDDGDGFDVAEVARRTATQHIGINIMQERAARINAALDVNSTPGKGTRVHLVLSRAERQAA